MASGPRFGGRSVAPALGTGDMLRRSRSGSHPLGIGAASRRPGNRWSRRTRFALESGFRHAPHPIASSDCRGSVQSSYATAPHVVPGAAHADLAPDASTGRRVQAGVYRQACPTRLGPRRTSGGIATSTKASQARTIGGRGRCAAHAEPQRGSNARSSRFGDVPKRGRCGSPSGCTCPPRRCIACWCASS